jgi:hypothetical protein
MYIRLTRGQYADPVTIDSEAATQLWQELSTHVRGLNQSYTGVRIAEAGGQLRSASGTRRSTRGRSAVRATSCPDSKPWACGSNHQSSSK